MILIAGFLVVIGCVFGGYLMAGGVSACWSSPLNSSSSAAPPWAA
jgi:flagellar motor component MotA